MPIQLRQYTREFLILATWLFCSEYTIMEAFDYFRVPDNELTSTADALLLAIMVWPVAIRLFRQINERQLIAEQAIKKLGQSQDALNRLINTASNGIVIIDDRGVIATDNDAARQILSKDGDNCVGQSAADLLPRELLNELDRCRPTSTEFEADHFSGRVNATRSDGRAFVLDVKIQTFLSAERTFLSMMLYDVTELAQSRSKLAQAQADHDKVFANLLAVCENVDFGLLLVDPSDRVQLVNQSYCRLWKIDRPEGSITLKDLFALSTGLKRDELNELHWDAFIKNVLERDQCLEGENIERPDGATLLYRFARLPNGYRLYTYLDATETANRQKIVEKARLAAEAANKAKSDFLASMSHELRTPLNGINGMASLLIDTELNPDQKLFAETIARSGDTLLTLVNDILDLSKIESGKFEIDNAPFNLATVTDDVMSIMVPRANENGVELIMRYSPALPVNYVGDGGRVRQILTNLVGNAVKFTNQGHILLDIDGQRIDDSVSLTIRVQDTGIGIPEDKIEKIFNKFEQVDASSNRKYSGTGLGLSITRQLTELMGGTITARSEFGAGSTFTIKLTLPAGIQQADLELAKLNIEKRRVLIVDDNPINRLVLQERLQSWRVEASLAQDAASALSVLDAEAKAGRSFDVILLDFQMPEINGYELAQSIHARDEFKKIPMIMLSSSPLSASLKEQNARGIVNALTKPVRASALFDCIASVVYQNCRDKSSRPGANSQSTNAPTLSRKLKVLVADDNKTNRLVMKSMLNLPLIDLLFAVDGQDAVERYEAGSPDIVFMDVSMPITDGYQATALIRKFEEDFERSRVPIIALTANALRGDREACLNSGMDDYLSKPVNRPALLNMLAKWEKAISQSRDAAVSGDGVKTMSGTPDAEADKHAAIDRQRLEMLAEQIGNDNLTEIVSEFVTECENAIEALLDQVKSGDTHGIRETLHLIRGCASNVGVDGLVSLADRTRDTIVSGGQVTDNDICEFSETLTLASSSLDRWISRQVS